YELVGAFGVDPELEPDEAAVRLCRLTRRAYEAMMAEDVPLARQRYAEILSEFPGDRVARKILDQLGPPDEPPGLADQTQ
ncbi:MAG: hypothetical protein WD270_10695, partial [Acetobacterales bacterium]